MYSLYSLYSAVYNIIVLCFILLMITKLKKSSMFYSIQFSSRNGFYFTCKNIGCRASFKWRMLIPKHKFCLRWMSTNGYAMAYNFKISL